MIGNNKSTALNILIVSKSDTKSPLAKTLNTDKNINQVFECDSVSQAIQIGKNHKIGLLVVDFFLQDGTILEFLQPLRSLATANLPIIVLTEENCDSYAVCAYRKGVNLVLVKDEKLGYAKYIKQFIAKTLQAQNNNLSLFCQQANMNQAMICLDKAHNIRFVSPGALGYLGENYQQLVKRPFGKAFGKLGNLIVQYIKESIDLANVTMHPQPVGTFKLSDLEHHLSYCEIMVYPVFTDETDINGFMITITERPSYTNDFVSLYQQHEIDPLTSTLSREAFLARLEYTLNYCKRYQQNSAVLHIDIDGFKSINDALGHRIADQLLKRVAERIKAITRNVDILARIGPDEFMLLLTHINQPEEAARVADKLMRLFKDPITVDNHSNFITLSVGISIFEQDADTLELLLQCARSALSLAKDKGRNNYQFYKPELTKSTSSTLAIANDLHVALERSELELFYQPQLCAQTHKVIGLEALIRWRHPEKGMISPALFIPIAEQMGMINEIGNWVIHKACKDIKIFEQKGFGDQLLAINLSIQQFMQETFIQDIQKIIKKYDVQPNQIEFEITESLFAQDMTAIIEKITQLRELGFYMVIDDFGTGYSSLSYLKDLPIQGLKIDRSFVQSLGFNEQDNHEAIILAIVTLAKQLKLKVLAEGIETSEQSKIIQALGCDYVQGFLFAKPLCMADTLLFLEENNDKDDISKVV